MGITADRNVTMTDEQKFCDVHGAHCVLIERIEKDIVDQKNESRDTRRSLTHDMERRDTALLTIAEITKSESEKRYVSKAEFDPIKKLVYLTVSLMIADVIRRVAF